MSHESRSFAKIIDHALLHPTLTDVDIYEGCQMANRLGVASVCVKPYAVALAARLLQGSSVAVGTVIGFPHGSHATQTKQFEADGACQQGARELDMVVNIGMVIQGEWDFVARDIVAVVDVSRRHGAITKVIFENDFLPDDTLKIRLCEICRDAGVDFVKTSTGFGFVKQSTGQFDYRGATVEDVRLMRTHCGPTMQVKAAGGIRNYEDAKRMYDAGATRIGTSATEMIVGGQPGRQAGY
ncbi:MAG: deoxyribose-phosphate aldolase [Pirellulaceae bacterium]|nr:deoxyribose-phosphate aldolase [Planctomycetales bacterium]